MQIAGGTVLRYGASMGLPDRFLWMLVSVAGCAEPHLADTAVPETPAVEGAPVFISTALLRCEAPSTAGAPFVEWSSAEWDAQPVDPADGDTRPAGWGLALADFDGDDALDLFLPGWEASTLWLGDGAGGFVPAPAASLPDGLAGARLSAAIAVDLDGDGDMDLATAGAGPHRLLRNDGAGVFEDATALGGPRVWESAASFGFGSGDLDGDGLQDLILPTVSAPEGEEGGFAPSHLLVQQEDGSFAEDTRRRPDLESWGLPFGAAALDLDVDGDLDLFVLQDVADGGVGNQVWRNDGETMTEVSADWSLGHAQESMGLAVSDLNEDGRPDLLVTAIDRLVVAESASDGRWVDTAQARGIAYDPAQRQHVGWGTDFVDVDNDADLDIWMGFGEKKDQAPEEANALLVQGAEGGFLDAAPGLSLDHTGQTRGGLWEDLNDDGALDLVARHLGAPASVHLSPCGQGAAIVVELGGPGANTRAVGARVRVTVGERTQTRWVVLGGTSIASGGSGRLHVGLGDASRVDTVQVDWPDGERTRVGPLRANQRVRISRE